MRIAECLGCEYLQQHKEKKQWYCHYFQKNCDAADVLNGKEEKE